MTGCGQCSSGEGGEIRSACWQRPANQRSYFSFECRLLISSATNFANSLAIRCPRRLLFLTLVDSRGTRQSLSVGVTKFRFSKENPFDYAQFNRIFMDCSGGTFFFSSSVCKCGARVYHCLTMLFSWLTASTAERACQ